MSGFFPTLRRLGLAAALVWAVQAQAHQASDAYANVRESGGNTVIATLAVALKDLDLALPEADADNNRELTWDELQAAMPSVQRWLGQHALLTCKDAAGGDPAARAPAWVYDALEERSSGVYARLRAELPCPADAALTLHYTLLRDLDPTHRLIVKSETQGEARAAVLAPGAAPFTLRAASQQGAGPAPKASGWQTFRNFVPEGIHHLLSGYDHLAFLLALLLPLSLRRPHTAPASSTPAPRRMGLRELLWTVTAFTVGHSVTLVLASLGWSAVPVWVEPAIAVSIGFAAWLNLYPQPWLPPRWLALGFGLVHGLGFANVMQEADLSQAPLAWALAGFNTGVELGQLACVAVWCALNLAVARWKAYDLVVTRGGSLALIALALFWTWERVA